MSNLTYQVRSRSFISYYKKSAGNGRTWRQKQQGEKFVKSKTYSGLATKGSQKRLTRAIENLLDIAEFKIFKSNGREYLFKVNFVTLTLYSYGGKIPGKEAHEQCLAPLLLWLKRHHNLKAYIWKAELQAKRKDCHQLHYHLITDVYIDKDELRDKWNEYQEKAGYLDTWFERFGYFKVDKKTGEFVRNLPNSTDVHAIHNKKNLPAYFRKAINKYSNKRAYARLQTNTRRRIGAEMGKQVQNWETVEGKIWDCSVNLKSCGYREIEGFEDMTKAIAEGVAHRSLNENKQEHCTIYECLHQDAINYLPHKEKIMQQRYRDYIRNFERGAPKVPMDVLNHLLWNGRPEDLYGNVPQNAHLN